MKPLPRRLARLEAKLYARTEPPAEKSTFCRVSPFVLDRLAQARQMRPPANAQGRNR